MAVNLPPWIARAAKRTRVVVEQDMFADIALVAWIVISVALFALVSPRRAFLLTYVIGYLILPVEIGGDNWFIGSIYLTQSIRIDKLTACNIGAMLGTCVFAIDYLSRFRPHWVDGAGLLVLGGALATSLANGLGPKDGISHVIEYTRLYATPIFLARIYLTGPEELYEAVRVVIAGAFCYSFLSVAEWRLSPQAHRIVYGYFQHSFDQFGRYGHFRPIGFLRHAIEFSFFMGTSTALAAWLWFRGLLRPLWGLVPPWMIVVALVVGTATTMTFSGYAALALCAGAFFLVTVWRSRWALMVLPGIAICWMAGRYTGAIDGKWLVSVANSMDADRALSLQYRLDSERLNLASATNDPILGKGAINGVVRSDDGRFIKAVDAWWMITLVFYGFVGLIGWYLIWWAGLGKTFSLWRELDPDMRTLAAGVCVVIGAQYLDFLFNAFPSPLLMILVMGTLATLQRYRQAARMQALSAMEAALLAEEDDGPELAMP